jgi:hypothetical protein
VQRFSVACLHLSANIIKFMVKMCFSHILFLCSTESIVQNFSPVLYIVVHYTRDIAFFFWTVFLAMFATTHTVQSSGNKCCLFNGIYFLHPCTLTVTH